MTLGEGQEISLQRANEAEVMAIVKCKPTSACRRHMVKVVTPELHKGAPHAPLLEKKSSGGRNNAGRITTRHIGGGHKQHYRVIDFK